MSFVYSNDMAGLGVLLGLIPMMTLPALVGIASYVLSSMALYTLASRRGLNKPWMAWIPVVNCWLLGSLSDQYRYVVRGQNRSKRKSLLTLGIVTSLSGVIEFIMAVVMVGNIIVGALHGVGESYLVETVLGPAMGILGLSAVLLAVSIAYAIIRYMALYDIYKSMDPNNCVVFLVLSIVLNVTEPFFMFFNRNKDLGMPPRREQPDYTTAEPWETI